MLSITDGNGNKLENLLLDRGYTGHEHLASVGLIHMNGRLYDPTLHRFLMPDNYIQDPFNTQNFNRYGYCLNNPLVYVDKNGEFFITAGIIIGAIVGAYIGGSQANGTYNPFKWDYSSGNTWLGIGGGAVIGGVSGVAATYVGGLAAAGLATHGITGGIIGGAAVGAASGIVGGAISGGFMSLLPGGDGKFWSSATRGALSGFVGGAVIGGTIGAFTTPKGHNIWTGREIPQPVQTLETTPMGVHLDVENNITGNLELNAPTTNSVALDVQQPKLIPIKTPDGGIRLVSVENISTKSLNPTQYITKSKSQMQALLNDIRTNGIQKPIKYVNYNGVKYIVNGHHRFFIAQKLGIQNIPAQQVQLPYQGYKTFQDLIIDTGKQPGFWKFMK